MHPSYVASAENVLSADESGPSPLLPPTLVCMPMETDPASPIPVRQVAQMLSEWIGRLGAIWIEGEVSDFSRRGNARWQFLTLRDLEANASLTVVAETSLISALEPPLEVGQRVAVWAKPEFWSGRGSLNMRARSIRSIGLGELLARLAQLKATLAAEGLFSAERKRPLPFLPTRIGLVCGRNSDAMHDVIVNARKRWPAAEFDVREVEIGRAHV